MDMKYESSFSADRCRKECSNKCAFGDICPEYVEWLETMLGVLLAHIAPPADAEEYNLCYFDGHSLWFSMTNPEEVWGDGWNDSPISSNAGDPYDKFGPFLKLSFDAGNIEIVSPVDYPGISVNIINRIDRNEKMRISWLAEIRPGAYISDTSGGSFELYPGDTYTACIIKMINHGITPMVPYTNHGGKEYRDDTENECQQ